LAPSPTQSTAAAPINPGRGRHSPSRTTPFIRHAAGFALVTLSVAAVAVRQVISNATVPAPSTDAETALGVNAFAQLTNSDLSVSASWSDTVASWQIAGYSYLTSANDRHDTLIGLTREFVLVTSVMTAVLIVAACRRWGLGWFSTGLAVVLAGVPAATGMLRIVSAAGVVATFWVAVGLLAAVAAADNRHRSKTPLLVLTAVAGSLSVLTAVVSAVLLLGLILGGLVSGRLCRSWDSRSRIVASVGSSVALVVAFVLTVFTPSVPDGGGPPVELLGAGVAFGGLLVAAACYSIPRIRPLALGVVPVLLAAAWPGAAQASALILAMTAIAVLTAGSLDSLLSQRRPAPDMMVGTVALVIAVAVGAFILPVPETSASTRTPGAQVATWIQTQLAPETVIEVDPLARAQLVRDGLDPLRLSTPGQPAIGVTLMLAPLSAGADFPLIARFGSGSAVLGLRLVVPDAADYAEALIADQAARVRFGAALVENPNLRLGADAAATLSAGAVDARLMVGLAGASSFARFAISEFTGSTGDVDSRSIRRQVTLTDITALDPAAGGSLSAASALSEFFSTQGSLYQPLAVVEAGNTLTVRYAAPSPLGVLA